MSGEESTDHLGYRGDPVQILNIVSAEYQAVFHIALYGTDQSLGDAVWCFFGIAFFQTAVAFGNVFPAQFHLFQKSVADGSGGHAYGDF